MRLNYPKCYVSQWEEKKMHLKLVQLLKFKHGLYFYFSGILYCWSSCNAKYISFVSSYEALLEANPQGLDA